MFERQWNTPSAVTRPLELDPRALGCAIGWLAGQMEQSNARNLEVHGVDTAQAVSEMDGGLLAFVQSVEPEDRYSALIAGANKLADSSHPRFVTPRPLAVLPNKQRSGFRWESDASLVDFKRQSNALTSTWRGLSNSKWTGGPVLALWPDEPQLARIADDIRTTALCIVPAKDEDISAWCFGLRPQMLGVQEVELWGPGLEVLDPVVETALHELTIATNVQARLISLSDRVHAITVFQLLWEGGHDVVPKEVQAWALSNGWQPKGAFTLREVAERITAGGFYRLGPEGSVSHFDSKSLRTWRELARNQHKRRPVRRCAKCAP